MRSAFFILLFLNCAFFAWAGWIDAPVAAERAQPALKLPQLKLASEARTSSGGRASPAGEPRCVSVGPFDSAERTDVAATLLRARGVQSEQRAEQAEVTDGYWVYVGGLKTAAAQDRVLRILDQAELSDAHVMPEDASGRRVSVGLFSERVRAERRAHVLQRLGLEPQIAERRSPATAYWLNLKLAANDNTVSTEGLLPAGEANARLEVRVCPGG